jgi:hypothetical protein
LTTTLLLPRRRTYDMLKVRRSTRLAKKAAIELAGRSM